MDLVVQSGFIDDLDYSLEAISIQCLECVVLSLPMVSMVSHRGLLGVVIGTVVLGTSCLHKSFSQAEPKS